MPRSGNRSTANVTILGVAKEAGVSYGTVSRVINDDVHVKAETRERVLKTMKKLGYVVNRQARVLAGGKSKTIGVLVPDLGTGYIGEIMRGIDTELGIAGYDLILYTTHRAAAKETSYVDTFVRGMVDGLLLVLPRNPTDYINNLAEHKFPFVLIDHQGTGQDCAAVGAANWQGAYNATEYLISLGHRRIGFITGWMDLGAAQDRLSGYQEALRNSHIPLEKELVFDGTFAQADGYTGAKKLLELPNPPTAFFASNDVMAMGVMDGIREKGLRIPEDVSVVGFDDIPQAASVRPAMTTVRQPLEKMGQAATQMLLDLLAHPQKKTERFELPTELIIRDSCRPVKTN
jgi:LacI family transcriptional regulator